MAFCLWEWPAAMSSFEAPLVVLQDGTGNCPIQRKRKQRRLSDLLLSICWFQVWKADFWNAMHIHSDFLTTSSPAEGKVRSIGGKCSRWRMHASCVITFASVSMVCSVWQVSELVSMKLLHVVMPKIVTGSPDLDNFVQIPQKKGSLQKPGFSRQKLGFLTGPTNFWVFEALGGWL